MAKAKTEGGLYYRPDGTAVDAEGNVLKGAPARDENTDPTDQPGGAGSLTPEERIGVAVAKALNPKSGSTAAAKAPAKPAATTTDASTDDGTGDEIADLPTIADLPGHLATLTSAKDVRALKRRDERKSAVAIYQARLDEIKSGE